MVEVKGTGVETVWSGCRKGSLSTRTIPIANIKANKKYSFKIIVFEDYNCSNNNKDKYFDYMYSPDLYTYDMSKYKNTGIAIDPKDPNNLSVNEITNMIGGQNHYCKLDVNGNRKSCTSVGINTVFACVAYSQIGYQEKNEGIDVNICGTGGSGNYQKYGNSGTYWCDSFVKWSLTRAGVDPDKIEFPSGTSNIETWAINKRIFYTDESDLHEGDLVIFNGHIGLAYKNKADSSWHIIHGNWGDAVKDQKISSVEDKILQGYVNMNGYAY